MNASNSSDSIYLWMCLCARRNSACMHACLRVCVRCTCVYTKMYVVNWTHSTCTFRIFCCTDDSHIEHHTAERVHMYTCIKKRENMSALGSLTARLSCCCNTNAAVYIVAVIVPSSSCTRHCISTLFNVLHAHSKCIDTLARICERRTHTFRAEADP